MRVVNQRGSIESKVALGRAPDSPSQTPSAIISSRGKPVQ
jgi:hypothetical protein